MDNKPTQTQDQVLQEILENSRKTRQYMKWQFIIVVALIVIPFIAATVMMPYVLQLLFSGYRG